MIIKPEFLKKAVAVEPVESLPRIQAKEFRLQDAIFDSITPRAAKEKLRAAVPGNASVVIYKTPEDFNAVVRHHQELDWVKNELRALPSSRAVKSGAVSK